MPSDLLTIVLRALHGMLTMNLPSATAIVTGDKNLIQPAVMKNFHPMGGIRVVLDVIVPSATGITAER